MLSVEIQKTNDLISKLVPFHILNVIKNEKREVDELDDCTMLYTDMIDFAEFTKSLSDPKEAAKLLNKLFTRFDQLCEENRVYKVHTLGDSYVVMGYNGKIDKQKRHRGIAIEEASRVINVGLEMLEIVNELRVSSNHSSLENLRMRVGIHTGPITAGIIGSKVVRYDLFGEGVLVASKMKRNGMENKVSISDDTRRFIMQAPEVANEFYFEDCGNFLVKEIGKTIRSFVVTQKHSESESS